MPGARCIPTASDAGPRPVPIGPTPAIRSFCLYRCMGGDAEAVAGCELSPDVDPRYSPCHLYSFRCGCNPNYAAATAGRT